MTVEILIDPNVRVANDETFSGFEDVVGALPAEGDSVHVREPESNVVGEGVVTRVDHQDRLIYVAVKWEALAPEPLPTAEELLRKVRAAMAARMATAEQTIPASESASSSQTPSTQWYSFPNRESALTA